MKTTTLLLTLATVCLIVTPAFATESTEGSMREKVKTKIEERKIEVKEKTTERVKEEVEKRSGKRSELLAKECARVSANATSLIAKIRERIDRAKVEGRNMTEAEASLTQAKSYLADATSLCNQAVAKFDAIPTDSKESTSAAFTEARALARQAREQFVLMRKALAETVKLIRGLGVRSAEPTKEMKPTPSPVTKTEGAL